MNLRDGLGEYRTVTFMLVVKGRNNLVYKEVEFR